MKNMWKMRKSKEAVSPVIATILMVAITVVLAAVLYVMVMGFGGGGAQAPAATINKVQEKIYVNVNPATDFADMEFSVDGGTAVVFADDARYPAAPATAYIIFTDVGADGKVTTGDYFTIVGTYSGSLSILWIDGDTTQSLVTLDF